MPTIDELIQKSGEIGYVKKVVGVIVYCDGLPGVKPGEVVVFENGERGKVISLAPDEIEIMSFGRLPFKVGQKVARTGEGLSIAVGQELLGKVIDPFGTTLDG